MAKVKIKLFGTWDAWSDAVRWGHLIHPDGSVAEVLLRTTDEPRLPAESRRLLSSLSHPSILQLFHATTVDAKTALVYEHFEGVAMARILPELKIRNRQMPVRAALEICEQVCQALLAARKVTSPGFSIVHPGPSPSQLLINEQGSVRIAGFSVLSDSSELSGAPSGYIPPEGCGADGGWAYGVGALIVELLSGDRPATGSADPSRHEAMIRRALIRVLARSGEPAPESVINLVRQCMARQPQARPALQEVTSQIHELVNTLPSSRLRPWASGCVPAIFAMLQPDRPSPLPISQPQPAISEPSSPLPAVSSFFSEDTEQIDPTEEEPRRTEPIQDPPPTAEQLSVTPELPTAEHLPLTPEIPTAEHLPLTPEIPTAEHLPLTPEIPTAEHLPLTPEIPTAEHHPSRPASASGLVPENRSVPSDREPRVGFAPGDFSHTEISGPRFTPQATDSVQPALALGGDFQADPVSSEAIYIPRRNVAPMFLGGFLAMAALWIVGVTLWRVVNLDPEVTDAPPASMEAVAGVEEAPAIDEPLATPAVDDPSASPTVDEPSLSSAVDVQTAAVPPRGQAVAPSADIEPAPASPERALEPQEPEVVRITPTRSDDPAPAEVPIGIADAEPTAGDAVAAAEAVVVSDALPAGDVMASAEPIGEVSAEPVPAPSVFRVEFRAADPTMTELQIRCHKGSGSGMGRVVIPDAGRGPCKVIGIIGSDRLVTSVSLTGEKIWMCFADGARSCQ